MDQPGSNRSTNEPLPPRRHAFAPAALGIIAALLFGCGGGPTLVFPGGALAGTEVAEPVTDWSFVDARFVDLETRPSDPYSVELNYILRDGKLYIDPSEGKRWLDHIREDPRVRVRFGDEIYRATAVLVGEPGELPDFDPERFIYRLDPR
ncbi:MAG: hypothetical protein QNK05_18275 [Myxococcota bacterium]|nr:hypothetical protein [Myxococcota bacterium]